MNSFALWRGCFGQNRMLAGENINFAYGSYCGCIGDLWFDCENCWLIAEKRGAGVCWLLLWD